MMLEIDDPLMAPGVAADPHNQAPLGRFNLKLVRLSSQPRHPDLVAITEVGHLRVALPSRAGSAPGRNQEIIKERIEDAFEIVESPEGAPS